MARPDQYSAGLADLICDRISRGESLLAICAEDGMPSQSMVYRWLDKYVAFREKYARARDLQCDSLADEALQVARNGSAEMANANRVRLDAIKWFAAKVAPKKYGEKLDIESTAHVTVADDTDRPPRETREQWIARRAKELGVDPRLLGTPAGAAD